MNRASASPPASSRTRAAGARALGLTALAALSLSTWACTLSQNGVVPPSDTFFYPTSGAMSPLDGVTQVLVGWSAVGDHGTIQPPKGVTVERDHVLVPLTLTNYEARIIVLKKF